MTCVEYTSDIVVFVNRLAIFGTAGTSACPGLNGVVLAVEVDVGNLGHQRVVARTRSTILAKDVVLLDDVGSICLDITRLALWALLTWLIPSRISHWEASIFTFEFRVKLDHALVENSRRFGMHDDDFLLKFFFSKGFWILRIQFYARNGNDTVNFNVVEIQGERLALRFRRNPFSVF